MFRKKKNKKVEEDLSGLGNETKRAILGVIFIAASLFFILAAFGNAGVVGRYTYDSLGRLFGFGYYLFPTVFIALGTGSFRSEKGRLGSVKIIGGVIFFVSALGLISIANRDGGGQIGEKLASPLLQLFDLSASVVILSALLVGAVLTIFDAKLSFAPIVYLINRFRKNNPNPDGETENKPRDDYGTPTRGIGDGKPVQEDAKEPRTPKVLEPFDGEKPTGFISLDSTIKKGMFRKFIPIPLDLLEGDRGKPGVGDIKANVNIIKRTLQNFGINVEMDEVTIGPTVTRYALKPAEGIKLSRIVALQNDLALALAAHPIRIEAPIPGKSLVGIEIPNTVKTTVGLGSMLAAEEFQTSDKPMLIALGKGISGRSYFGNLGKMPHLLIAGATGSGKSVTIHSITTSLLYRNSPEDLKFIMIDPKRVELTLYNNIPHLLTPVITDAKKAILALRWAAKEMDRRYDILEAESVRDIDSYHKNVVNPALRKKEEDREFVDTMPYIVIVLDELADIMSSYPRELETAVVKLAQMSRAVGIHLILSTQRPSVNVITGLIKANIPARIALQVASQIDSRTILDAGGAEKLLGAGDMLYLSGDMSQPARIQSAYITESEVKSVVKFLKEKYEDQLPASINLSEKPEKDAIFDLMAEGTAGPEDEDELYPQAKDEVIKAGKASTSYLQRRFRIGYARAARLIDILEQKGVIGPGEGAKPREVLVGRELVEAEITNSQP